METVTHKALQKTVKELNEKFGLKLKHISTREDLIAKIVENISNATEEQQEMLSPDAVDVYNSLLAVPVLESEEDEESEEVWGPEACSAFGVSYAAEDPECEACDMAKQCSEETEAAKLKLAKAAKKEKNKKVEVAKSRYGHKAGSMSAEIDDLLWHGSTMQEMIATLMKKFNKSESAASTKVKGHLVHLKKQGVVNVQIHDDQYKVDVENI